MHLEQHPSYGTLAPYLEKYPSSSGALWQTYNDLVLAQKWTDVVVLDLESSCSRTAIRGIKPTVDEPNELMHVLPCTLAENLSIDLLQKVFIGLSNPPAIYLAINSEDSSIVYYKISNGIIKPQL